MKYENSYEKKLKEKIPHMFFNIPEYLSCIFTEIARKTGTSKPNILTIIAYKVIIENQHIQSIEETNTYSMMANAIIEKAKEEKERIIQLSFSVDNEDKLEFERISELLSTNPQDLMLVSCYNYAMKFKM